MFEGAHTALVTPMSAEGAIDVARLRALVGAQAEAGIDGVVPVGTTGESPTLTVEEHAQVIAETIAAAAGRVKVIAGTGANATAEAIALTRGAMEAGADATLQVTPYYNKPSQAGLVAHFSAVADLGLPVILYHVPGRSACDIEVETVAELARHPAIVAIKEAGGSVDRVSRIRDACDIEVLSGDDSLTLPMMAVGAVGVISVASNLIPAPVARMVHDALAGRWEEAREAHRAWYPLFRDLFVDTNPVPVKAAMAMLGQLDSEGCRLPLVPLSGALREVLSATLRRTGLLAAD